MPVRQLLLKGRRFSIPRSRWFNSSSRAVMSWGDGSHGALGLPSSPLGSDAYEPTLVQGLPSDVLSIGVGHYHSLAVTAQGEVWAWGRNLEGQLGRGLSDPRESWNEPKRVQGLDGVRVRAAFASGVISAAIGDDGSLWVWGRSKRGQLGLGKGVIDAVLPSRVEMLAGEEIVKVSLGWGHALALTKDGKLFGWGYSADGRLGQIGEALEMKPEGLSPTTRHQLGSALEVVEKLVLDTIEKENNMPIIWEPCLLPELNDVKISDVACGLDHSLILCGVKQDAGQVDPKPTSPKPTSEMPVSVMKGGGQMDELHGSKCVSQIDEHVREKLGNSSDGSGLSEIEQLMKGKTFSRDELDRLMEILHSRVIDHSDVDEREKKNTSMTAVPKATGDVWGEEKLRTPFQERQADILSGVRGGVANPILQPTIRDEVGSSPVEIAKAYMGTRASESSLNSQSRIWKDERTPVHNNDFASRRMSILPSSFKSSIFHPGAVVQEQSSYLTPQTQRGRIGLHNFPRTPYSRTVYPRSTSKVTPFQGVWDSSRNILSTQSKQLQSPVYGSRQTKAEILDDGLGSVGPIRRIRQKVVSTTSSRVAGSPYPASSRSLWTEDSDPSKTFLPTFKRNLDPGASSSGNSAFQPGDINGSNYNVGATTVHPQSSELARKILEHLDRTVPTPKEKSAELKLAMVQKKPHSEFTTSRSNEQIGRLHVEDSDSQKTSNLLGENFSAQGNEDRGISFFVNSKTNHSSQIKTHEVSMGVGDSGRSQKNQHSGRSQKNQPFPLRNQMDVASVQNSVCGAAVSEGLPSQMKPPSQSSGAKLGLTSISINKPDPKRAGFPDNGAGFSFPVSASFGALSEPPTPSIMPSSSARSLPQQEEGNTVPLYSFGSKSGQNLVFSFPSTSTSISTQDDSSTPKFTFGSDRKKPEVSFSSLGKDALCC